MKRSRKFLSEKDLRLFVKRFLKDHLKGLPEGTKIEIKVLDYLSPKVQLLFPFYSEGNVLRALEVDFLVKELYNVGIEAEVYYLDDWEVFLNDESFGVSSE